MCSTILLITIYEKIGEGGWLTLFLTSALVGLCFLIHGHYQKVTRGLRKLDTLLDVIPATGSKNTEPVNPHKMTAVQLVTGFHGFGVNTFYSIIKNFPGVYENFIFVSIAVVDSGTFKGSAEITALSKSTRNSLIKYVDLAREMGFASDYRMDFGTDVVDLQYHSVKTSQRSSRIPRFSPDRLFSVMKTRSRRYCITRRHLRFSDVYSTAVSRR